MIILGLTGSIGMGKSTASEMLRQMNIPVHDSDRAVHQLLAAGGAGVAPILTAFPGTDDGQGGVDRRKLRAAAGYDHAAWDRLEHILHPLVQGAQSLWLAQQSQKGEKIVALDIPLLFETGAEKRVNYTICVSAPADVQRARVLGRPYATEEDFTFRLSRQMPDAEKRRRSTFVVSTAEGLEPTRSALEKIVTDIRAKHFSKDSFPHP